jgi:hypothetical protein
MGTPKEQCKKTGVIVAQHWRETKCPAPERIAGQRAAIFAYRLISSGRK